MLTLAGVSAAYDGRPVLREVDLEVAAGELLCVLGPSGGGKSTLLRVIAGLEPPTGGRVVLDGRDLAGVPPHERDVGLMFQDYALFPHRNVGQNVAFGLHMQGQAAEVVRARVSELLELVGLPGAESRPVAQLSGGEQQRVALARALAPRPRLLMLDEPMGSLDRSLRERLPEELRAIFAELGLSVIYVTHDQDEALGVADRVALLADGRIVAEGTPEALWTRPPSAWTARFLGFRNVAPGRREGSVLETPWGRLPLAVGAEDTTATGDVTVVLRPNALVVAPDGPVHGRVAARRFRGDHVLLVIEVAEASPLYGEASPLHAEAPPLYVEAREGALPEVGAEVRLALPHGGVHVIDEPAPDHGGPIVDDDTLPSVS